jgi:hypothetical protein
MEDSPILRALPRLLKGSKNFRIRLVFEQLKR